MSKLQVIFFPGQICSFSEVPIWSRDPIPSNNQTSSFPWDCSAPLPFTESLSQCVIQISLLHATALLQLFSPSMPGLRLSWSISQINVITSLFLEVIWKQKIATTSLLHLLNTSLSFFLVNNSRNSDDIFRTKVMGRLFWKLKKCCMTAGTN